MITIIGFLNTGMLQQNKNVCNKLGLKILEFDQMADIFAIFEISKKMPQSGEGSMQGKNTGNMPSAMCASSMNKSLDPTPIYM